MASADLDPRFDPIYQRGYDGRVDVTPRPQPLQAQSESFVSGPPSYPAAAPVLTVPEAVPEQEDAEPTLRGNPWVRVLWVVGSVFVLVGIGGNAFVQSLYNSGTVFTTSSDPWLHMLLPTLIQSISQWMTLVGLATLVGTLFLYAVRWRPHH